MSKKGFIQQNSIECCKEHQAPVIERKNMKLKKVFFKSLKVFIVVILSAALLFFCVRAIGQQFNKSIPENGINESMMINVNGTEEWISIYGRDKSNPVLLVLHGGPGASQSAYSYEYQKEWSDKYTVVSWDQRGCGLSKDDNLSSDEITFNLLLSDSLEVVNYIREYLNVEKIMILGYSWGSMLGARLAYEYPQYFDAYIAAGQLVDTEKNELEFKREALKWAKDDDEGQALVDRLTPEKLNIEYYSLKSKIMSRYKCSAHKGGYGFNYFKALYVNPYYSIVDLHQYFNNNDEELYLDFINSDDFNKYTILDQIEYKIPIYFICGDKDYQTNVNIAKEYYDSIKAPAKQFYMIENCTHGLMETHPKEFAEILNGIELQ